MLSFWTQFVIFCLHPCFRLKLHLLEKMTYNHSLAHWLTVKLDLKFLKMSFLVIQMISHWPAHFSLFGKSVILVGQWNKMYAVDHLPFLKERFTAWFHLSIYGFCSGRLIGIILLPSACSSFDPSYHWISTGCYFLTLWRNQFLCSFSCILFTGSILKLLECKYFRNYYTLTSYFWEIES